MNLGNFDFRAQRGRGVVRGEGVTASSEWWDGALECRIVFGLWAAVFSKMDYFSARSLSYRIGLSFQLRSRGRGE